MTYRPEIDYEEIRRWLFHGDVQKLAQQTFRSSGMISRILHGKTKYVNAYVLTVAIDKAIRNKIYIHSISEPGTDHDWIDYFQRKRVR